MSHHLANYQNVMRKRLIALRSCGLGASEAHHLLKTGDVTLTFGSKLGVDEVKEKISKLLDCEFRESMTGSLFNLNISIF